jgi:glyoxylase-like metal-dependent hydrolase (beta-lactamase superfamily II)
LERLQATTPQEAAMIQAGQLAYYNKPRGSYKPLKPAHNFKTAKERVPMLWGDEMYVISIDGDRAKVSVKGHHLQIEVDDLRESPLLSVYQIDCGQGDSALVHFPDERWMMVDGGPARDWSNSGKIAADFLYWKMFVDQSWKNEFNFRRGPFHIEAVVCTHPDYDHFGGFMELTKNVKGKTLTYGTVYHNGMGRKMRTASARSYSTRGRRSCTNEGLAPRQKHGVRPY